MLVKKLVPVVMAAAMAFAGAEEMAARQTFVTIGTGGITGVYYPTGGAIA